MKKPILLLLAVSLVLAIFGTQIAASDDGGLLRLRMKPGQDFRMNVTTRQKTSADMSGEKMDVAQSTDLGVSYTVERVAPDGTIDFICTYETIRVRIKSKFGDAAFDSAAPKKADESLAKVLKPMVGASLQVRMSPAGRILEIRGIKEIIAGNKALKTPEQRQSAEKLIAGMLTPYLSGGMDGYPEKPARPGDSWTTQSAIDVGFPMDIRTTYLLKESKDGTHIIEASSEIASSAGKQDSKANAVPTLKGTQTGTIRVAIGTGWPVSSRFIQKISGEVTMQSGKKASSIPITIENTIECQSISN